MKILIAGGSGFLGEALARSFVRDGQEVLVLTRRPGALPYGRAVAWDGETVGPWGRLVDGADVIVNLCGKSLASWPWTAATRRVFLRSRVDPGRALAEAVRRAVRPPHVFVQASGINHYGLRGALADESTLPGDDFLARLTLDWEESTRSVEEQGVRRIVIRSAVVLDARGGMLPLMSLPVRMGVGGPLAGGAQSMAWIHLADEIDAIRFLIGSPEARGAFNLVAPVPTSNARFMRALSKALQRPYWLPAPRLALRLVLGGMGDLVAEGRYAVPKRLSVLGYRFQFPGPEAALADLFARPA